MKSLITIFLIILSFFDINIVYSGVPVCQIFGNPDKVEYNSGKHFWINHNYDSENLCQLYPEIKKSMERIPEKKKLQIKTKTFFCRQDSFSDIGKVLAYGGIVPNHKRKIFVDRSQKFTIQNFFDSGWGIDEEDQRSLIRREFDVSRIKLINMLIPAESSISGEDKIERINDLGLVRLDAAVLQKFLENQKKIPESWKITLNGEARCIFFDGTIVKDLISDRRHTFFIRFNGKEWDWNYRCLSLNTCHNHFSAVTV